MRTTLKTFTLVAGLGIALVSCGSITTPARSVAQNDKSATTALFSSVPEGVAPFDKNRDGTISQREFEELKANPDYRLESYTMSSKVDSDIQTQANGHTCVITNIAEINTRNPAGGYYSTVNFYVLANCDFAFTSLNGTAQRSDFTINFWSDVFLSYGLGQRASMSAGSLPRASGHTYGLSSQLNVRFTDGQMASGTGPAAFGTAN